MTVSITISAWALNTVLAGAGFSFLIACLLSGLACMIMLEEDEQDRIAPMVRRQGLPVTAIFAAAFFALGVILMVAPWTGVMP